MKNKSELTDFYYKELYPHLQDLEKQRKSLKSTVIFTEFMITLLFLLIIGSFKENSADFFQWILFAYIAITLGVYKFLIRDYKDEFKIKIMAPLITALSPKLSYSPNNHVSLSKFQNSEIINTRIDRFSGNDYVQGTIKDVAIEFSDVLAEKEYRDSKGRRHYSNLFQGLFISSDFNKKFHGRTVILPDRLEKKFGSFLSNWVQKSNFSRDELVKLDNNEFENEFVVYSTDQIEARYILSHSLMARLLAYKKKTKHPVYVSFKAQSIHLAIKYNKDMFEASLFRSLLNYQSAMEYVETLHLAAALVEELKLNQKLWSKR